MRLPLPDVTLFAVDTRPDMAIAALKESMARCRFGDVVLATNGDTRGPFRVVPLPVATWPNGYCEFCLRDMARHVRTRFVLIVHWDGYVVDARAWDPSFLAYDYIGARWPWHTDGRDVGNSGFCLRSKYLLDLLAAWPYPQPVALDDVFIGRTIRRDLERDHGVAFAPADVADRFAYERGEPDEPTFGFHGLFNMWRHVPDADMVAMAATFPESVTRKSEYHELIEAYRLRGRTGPSEALAARLGNKKPPRVAPERYRLPRK